MKAARFTLSRNVGGPTAAEAVPSQVLPGQHRVFPAFWRVNAVVWLALALFGMALRTALYEAPQTILALTLVLDGLGYAYTGLLHLVFRRLTVSPGRIWTVVLIACIAGTIGGLGQMQIAHAVRLATESTYREGYNVPFATVLFYGLIIAGWTIAYFWLAANSAAQSERLRRSEAEAAALRAELHQLQSQLDPHFLFNALNVIAAEIPEDAAAALDMTHAAAAVLRDRIRNTGGSLWQLADEVDHLRAYLRVQQLRYDNRLDCRLDCDDAALERLLPCYILQGLVENAAKHGARDADGRWHIGVTVQLDGDALVTEVTNYGELAPGADRSGGLGLDNMKRRLEIHYPGRYRFDIAQRQACVVARLVLEGAPCFA